MTSETETQAAAAEPTSTEGADTFIPPAGSAPIAAAIPPKPTEKKAAAKAKGASKAPPKARAAKAGEQAQAGAGYAFAAAGEAVPTNPGVSYVPDPEDVHSSDDLKWSDELGALGRIVSVTRISDDGTHTFTEVLPSIAAEPQVAAAKARLLKRVRG